ncbi:restriction endonuclease subunit S [Comamonas sp. B-9]|uniref:restriction endonuclease subunit S n=1 Tax=Comamonas sp. B-9 TaxID=1055192 RepID=UPI000395C8CE|nr:restriction endonuclease subunit S [Comamonas sp. B-9]
MSRYKAYPAYQDSEVEWLGEVPSHWACIPVGRLYRRTKRTNFPEKELLSVYRDYGVVPTSSRDDNNNKPSEDMTAYQLVEPDNLVMNKMKAWQGSIAISEYEGIVSPAYFVYEPNAEMFDLAIPKYIHYLLRHPIYVAQYLRQSKGIRVNQWDLDPDEFKKIELLLPAKEEQKKIINFLDHETAKIDALIEKQQRLIELLKEKRQAVISHAVTKGLNPNARMKDSGVEWLGEVPAHWVVSKVKHFATMQGGYAFNSELFKEDGVQILRIGNVYLNELSLERQPVFVDEYFLKTHRNFVVGPGDLLMSLTGTLGKTDYGFAVRVDKAGPFMLNQRVAKITPKESKISVSYLLYSVRSESYLKQLHSLPSGTKQANLSNEDVLNISIAVPSSIEEQNIISIYIAEQLSKYNSIIANSLSAIELLQERRTALISAAVTGKIDVRDWQAAA